MKSSEHYHVVNIADRHTGKLCPLMSLAIYTMAQFNFFVICRVTIDHQTIKNGHHNMTGPYHQSICSV